MDIQKIYELKHSSGGHQGRRRDALDAGNMERPS